MELKVCMCVCVCVYGEREKEREQVSLVCAGHYARCWEMREF